MPNREELDRLIEAALADSKLTSKEMEVLIKKAKQFGIDEDEFIIELDARKHRLRKARNEKIWEFINLNKKIIFSTLGVIFIFLLIFIPVKCNSKSYKLKQCIKESKLKYTDWQEALLHYDFENAYTLVTCYKSINYYDARTIRRIVGRISETEVNYLFSEGYISRGLEVAGENRVESILDEEYGITDEELLELILNNFKILVSKKQFNESFLLFKHYPFTVEPYQDYYVEGGGRGYNSAAQEYNNLLNLLLDKLLIENVSDFGYRDLLDKYKPLAKMGQFIKTELITRNVKVGEKILTDNKGRVQKKYNTPIKEDIMERRQEKVDQYGIVFSNEDRETAIRRIESKGIAIK